MNKKLKKKDLVGTCIIFLIIAFFIPFSIRTENESTLSVFSTAFTAIGAVATVMTLFIAIPVSYTHLDVYKRQLSTLY